MTCDTNNRQESKYQSKQKHTVMIWSEYQDGT
jgi:hypothetical protein